MRNNKANKVHLLKKKKQNIDNMQKVILTPWHLSQF